MLSYGKPQKMNPAKSKPSTDRIFAKPNHEIKLQVK
jgi:hypothetical protein